MLRLWSVAALVAATEAKIYFKETFNDAAWAKRWPVPTSWKSASDLGTWKQTTGEWYGDAEDKGVKTDPNDKFFGMSAKLGKPFDNKGKDLVISYTVKLEQKSVCGGAYIKLLPDMDQDSFGADTTYAVMFGPETCFRYVQKTHVIFHYQPKEDTLSIKEDVKAMADQLSHLYTLHVKPDNTYEVFIDKESVRSGNLKEDWDFLKPEEVDDPELHYRCAPCTHVGFEIYQQVAGTILDDILVTDSLDEAWAFADETFFRKQDKEKDMFDAAEKVRMKEERAARKALEEAAVAAAEDAEDDYADMARPDEL